MSPSSVSVCFFSLFLISSSFSLPYFLLFLPLPYFSFKEKSYQRVFPIWFSNTKTEFSLMAIVSFPFISFLSIILHCFSPSYFLFLPLFLFLSILKTFTLFPRFFLVFERKFICPKDLNLGILSKVSIQTIGILRERRERESEQFESTPCDTNTVKQFESENPIRSCQFIPLLRTVLLVLFVFLTRVLIHCLNPVLHRFSNLIHFSIRDLCIHLFSSCFFL